MASVCRPRSVAGTGGGSPTADGRGPSAGPALPDPLAAGGPGGYHASMAIPLNPEWTRLLDAYRAQHRDPRNQACHRVGIPMILASFPVGATIVGLPLAATLFGVGWGFQFLGHFYEGNDPAFFSDPRSLLVGALWWAEKMGLVTEAT